MTVYPLWKLCSLLCTFKHPKHARLLLAEHTKKKRLREVETYPQCTIIQDGRHTQDHYKFVIIVYPPAWPK